MSSLSEKDDLKGRIQDNDSRTSNMTREFLLRKLEEFKKEEKKVLKISYLDICGIVCCRCCIKKYQKKHDIITRTETECSKYLDYLDIIKLLQEFNKFKIFNMSHSQIKLFSFISKPKIRDTTEEQQNLKNDFLHGRMYDNQNLNDLYYHYLILKGENKLKDQKLFNLIDDDIIQCFEAMREQNI